MTNLLHISIAGRTGKVRRLSIMLTYCGAHTADGRAVEHSSGCLHHSGIVNALHYKIPRSLTILC